MAFLALELLLLLLLLHLDCHLLLLVEFLSPSLFHSYSFLLRSNVSPLPVFFAYLELGLFGGLFCVSELLHLLVLSLLLLLVLHLDSALLHNATNHVFLLNLKALG